MQAVTLVLLETIARNCFVGVLRPFLSPLQSPSSNQSTLCDLNYALSEWIQAELEESQMTALC
jgi:hypothetical protein